MSFVPQTYFLYIDSYYPPGHFRASGPYTLQVTGSFPVELIEFTVD